MGVLGVVLTLDDCAKPLEIRNFSLHLSDRVRSANKRDDGGCFRHERSRQKITTYACLVSIESSRAEQRLRSYTRTYEEVSQVQRND